MTLLLANSWAAGEPAATAGWLAGKSCGCDSRLASEATARASV
jgi:hypothetical protein